jgi:hypothetical protein
MEEMEVFVQSKQSWSPLTVNGIYTVFCVNETAASSFECFELSDKDE